MSRIAIIPARGGSKRIPKKNIKSFLGKPIIAYSIEAALASNLFDEVMVSTDSEEIAEIAKSYGAKVPFFRSDKNADDYATLVDVLLEVLSSYKADGYSFDYVCCILPTAPFVSKEKLQEGYKTIIDNDFDSVFPVLEFAYPIQRALQIQNDKVSMVWDTHEKTRSQDLEKRFHDSGQFYWSKTASLLKDKKLFTKNSGASDYFRIRSSRYRYGNRLEAC
ncbi:pseudaminic acid cytidylyltransferase [Winogradskyella sp. R77965]|uniref:pseudaminic acid cytidylyltransferase n=1 Tax=Winogradskyella sp. R77965 TaxID=3093872 RepID=UPI0037DCE38E